MAKREHLRQRLSRSHAATACALGVALAVLVLPLHHPRAADRTSLPAACFAPEALRAVPAERFPVKGSRKFDNDIPARALRPAEPVPSHLAGRAVRSVRLPKDKKVIALTFDFCEQTGEIAGYDGVILDTLRAEKVKATIFLGGKWMRSHDARTQQMLSDPLLEIASHGWSHKNLRLLTGSDLKREVAGPQLAYEEARERLARSQCMQSIPATSGGIPPRIELFRFPFGACTAESLKALNAEGLVPIQWNISTGDASPSQSAAAIAASVVRGAKPGAIVLMHGNGRGYHTAAALPAMIRDLRAKGYSFATVGELMQMGEPELAETCYDARPGDTDKYDALFPVATARRTTKEGHNGWKPVTIPR